MNHTKLITFLICSVFLVACSPSYPKKNLTTSLPLLLKKEYKLNSTAKFVGRTLYLDVGLSGLTSTDSKALTEVLKKVQGAMISITRVALSSDAKIDYMVVNAGDVSWSLNIRLIQRLVDVKGLLYQRISRSDYEGRLVLEIETKEKKSGTDTYEPSVLEEKHDIRIEEFMGRLIVSQINMASRTNPFLAVLLNSVQLKYDKWTPDVLYVNATIKPGTAAYPLFEDIVKKESRMVLNKYKEWVPVEIKITAKDGSVFAIPIPQANNFGQPSITYTKPRI